MAAAWERFPDGNIDPDFVLAWTVADLRGLPPDLAPGADEVDVALRLRLGRDLPSAVVGARA